MVCDEAILPFDMLVFFIFGDLVLTCIFSFDFVLSHFFRFNFALPFGFYSPFIESKCESIHTENQDIQRSLISIPMNCDGYEKDKSKYSIKHQANFSSIVFVASQKKNKINDRSKTKSRLMRTR